MPSKQRSAAAMRSSGLPPAAPGPYVDGGAQGATDRGDRPALLPVEAGGGHQLRAQSLGWADAVSQRRPRRGRQQYGRAFHAPNSDGKTQLIVQRERRRR